MGTLILSSKPVGETVPVVFNFLDVLAFGETITGVSTAATVFSGTDATPANILSGLPTNTASTATQVIRAGVAGVIYEIVCTITTSASNVLTKSGLIAVITPGGLFGA